MNKQNIGFIGCGNLALQAIKTLSGSYNIFYSNLSINQAAENLAAEKLETCLLYTSPSPRDYAASRMPSSA